MRPATQLCVVGENAQPTSVGNVIAIVAGIALRRSARQAKEAIASLKMGLQIVRRCRDYRLSRRLSAVASPDIFRDYTWVVLYDQPMERTDIETVLRDSLTDEGVRQWLNARNKYLGAVPADMLRAGQRDRVLEAARAFVEGTYL